MKKIKILLKAVNTVDHLLLLKFWIIWLLSVDFPEFLCTSLITPGWSSVRDLYAVSFLCSLPQYLNYSPVLSYRITPTVLRTPKFIPLWQTLLGTRLVYLIVSVTFPVYVTKYLGKTISKEIGSLWLLVPELVVMIACLWKGRTSQQKTHGGSKPLISERDEKLVF